MATRTFENGRKTKTDGGYSNSVEGAYSLHYEVVAALPARTGVKVRLDGADVIVIADGDDFTETENTALDAALVAWDPDCDLVEYKTAKIVAMAAATAAYLDAAFYLDRKIGLLGLFALTLDNMKPNRKAHIKSAITWGTETVPLHYKARKKAILDVACDTKAKVDVEFALFDLDQFTATKPEVTMITALDFVD